MYLSKLFLLKTKVLILKRKSYLFLKKNTYFKVAFFKFKQTHPITRQGIYSTRQSLSRNDETLAYLNRNLNGFLNMVPKCYFQSLNIDLFECFVILDFNFIDLCYLEIIILML